jgi:hypothetical protein
MPIDVALLSSALTTFLAPLLPYLVKGGEKAAEEVGGKVAEAGMDLAKRIWGKLRPAVESKPAAQEAVQDVAREPDQEDPRAALRLQLKKLLEQDPTLAQELASLLQGSPEGAVHIQAIGDRSVAGQSFVGSRIMTGDIHRKDEI